jgi:hypothetical protein
VKTYHVECHRTHCCMRHGCKYMDDDCPIASGDLEQEYLCEDCHLEGITRKEQLKWYATDMWILRTALDNLKIRYVVMDSGPQYENDPVLHQLLYIMSTDNVLDFENGRKPFYFENYKLESY